MAILLSLSQLPCIWEGSQLPCWSSGINRMKENSNEGDVLSSGLGTERQGRIVCSMKVATNTWPFQGNHKFHRSQGFVWLLNQRTDSYWCGAYIGEGERLPVINQWGLTKSTTCHKAHCHRRNSNAHTCEAGDRMGGSLETTTYGEWV